MNAERRCVPGTQRTSVRDVLPDATVPEPSAASSSQVTAGDPAAVAQAAAHRWAGLSGAPQHDVALVMGSGWVPAADALGAPEVEISVTDLPGFLAPGVAGHAGRVRSVRVGAQRVMVLLGRTHLYEGRGVDPVVHGVRTAAAAGCRTVVLTNAAGGVRQGLSVGQPVLVSDHLNLTARSPLTGARFVDLVDLYSTRLRSVVRTVDPSLEEGVYAALPGPHYETAAEIRMLRGMGADLVGMSTALEAIAARAEGMEVLAVSLVTNLAAGMTGQPLDHAEVLEAGAASAARVGELLAQVVPQL